MSTDKFGHRWTLVDIGGQSQNNLITYGVLLVDIYGQIQNNHTLYGVLSTDYCSPFVV